MYNDRPNSSYDDLIFFAYELPPVANPDRHAITTADICFRHPSRAEVSVGGTRHFVIGITAAGWMMIGGVGWRLIKADKTVAHKIATACNGLQRSLLQDRTSFDRSYERYTARASSGVIAGLREIHLSAGRYVVRSGDIASNQIEDCLNHHLGCVPSHINADDPAVDLPKGYINSEVWWEFA